MCREELELWSDPLNGETEKKEERNETKSKVLPEEEVHKKQEKREVQWVGERNSLKFVF